MNTADANCENGTVRFDLNQDLSIGPHAGYVQHCIDGQWRYLCSTIFSRVEANVICRQLGYSDQGVLLWKIIVTIIN